jgi:hypothetical protein
VILLFAQLFFIDPSLATIKFPQFSPSTIHRRHPYLHNMNLSTAAAALTDASLSPPPSPPPAGSSDMLDVMITACSAAVWDTEELRPMQQKIIRLMFDPDKPNAMLAVYRTGEGKSHVIRMVGVLDRGVCLIFIPLLTLSADVMTKFQSACQLYGSVRAYHLNEIYDNNRDIYNAVLQRCIDLPPSTPSTVFVFLSPQHLCRSSNATSSLLENTQRRTTSQTDGYYSHQN